jgi:hypothetical protein
MCLLLYNYKYIYEHIIVNNWHILEGTSADILCQPLNDIKGGMQAYGGKRPRRAEVSASVGHTRKRSRGAA